MIFVCTTTSEQKFEIKNETDFSSLKENILNGQPSDNQPEHLYEFAIINTPKSNFNTILQI